MFVAVAGIIGSGKSTLTGPLAVALGGEAFYEPVETNPYLEDFYKDPKQFALVMQFHLLTQRFLLHQQAVWSGKPVVMDRSIFEDVVFAKVLAQDGHIDERGFKTYQDHFKVMLRYLMFPDVMLYLHVTPELALERITTRARGCEVTIPLSYLQKLHVEYTKLMAEMQGYTRVVYLNWDQPIPAEAVANIVRHEIKSNPMPFARHL